MDKITQNRNYLVIYMLSWLLIAGAHFALLFFFLDVSWHFAVTDSLVYNLSFAILGLSVSYMVKYSGRDNRFRLIIVNQAIVMAVFLGIWLVVSFLITKVTFAISGNEIPETVSEWLPFRIMSGVLFYSVLALLQYVRIYVAKNQEQVIVRQQIQNELRTTQLKALKSQINPHFLFNSLNSISYLVNAEPEKAREMLSVLSEYFRYSIKSKDASTRLDMELENCKRYLEIERTRFGDRLIIKDTIDKTCKAVEVPAMILQPIYENAVKHGVYESSDLVVIETTAKDYGDYITITIVNDFDEDLIPRKGEGIGLKNVDKRLKLMFNMDGLLKYEKVKSKFVVKITIPKLQSHD